MGNSNKYKNEQKSNENLNKSAFFGKHEDIIEHLDSSISMKSEDLNIDNNFYEHLNSNEDLIKSTLGLSENDNF